MEIFELRYFLGVASDENFHRASERLRVSPPALSKAVSRLEEELGVSLFVRSGRNIRLSEAGILLQARALEICQIEESVRREIGGRAEVLRARLVGPEVLLAEMGPRLLQTLRKRFGAISAELHAMDEEAALHELAGGVAHLAIVTGAVAARFRTRKLTDVTFQTCVGKDHPLYERAEARTPVPVKEVLQHGFVSSHRALLGKVRTEHSVDGWRDDIYPRRVDYVVSSLKLLEQVVITGAAVAYLPDYYAKSIPVAALKIPDCPYVCRQIVKLVARGRQIGWVNQIF